MFQDSAKSVVEGSGPEAGVALFDRRGEVVFSDLGAVATSLKLRQAVLAYLSREAGLLAGTMFVAAVRRSGNLVSGRRRFQARARFTDLTRFGSLVDGGVLVVVDLVRVARSPYDELGLTPRERQVAGLLAEGLGNREIGERLGLKEPTVKGHLSSLLRKGEVASRGAFVALVRSMESPRAAATASEAPRRV